MIALQLVSTRIEIPVDIQILLKLSNDDCMFSQISFWTLPLLLFPPLPSTNITLTVPPVVPAILRFAGDKFSVVHSASGSKKAEKDQQYPYEAIESLWVRARPLHLDVRYALLSFSFCCFVFSSSYLFLFVPFKYSVLPIANNKAVLMKYIISDSRTRRSSDLG